MGAKSFHLRIGDQDHLLVEGTLVIGRSSTADLTLEDSLISRHHCAIHFREGRLWLVDLKSRNGILVNGTRIHGQVDLTDGDRITVGRNHLTLVEAPEDGTMETDVHDVPADTRPTLTEVEVPETTQGSVFDMFIDSTVKALEDGDLPAAENVASNLFVSVRAALVRGKDTSGAFEAAADLGLEIAERTQRRRWVEKVITLYAARHAWMPPSTIERLEALHEDGVYAGAAVDRYLAALHASGAGEGAPGDLERIERLARAARIAEDSDETEG